MGQGQRGRSTTARGGRKRRAKTATGVQKGRLPFDQRWTELVVAGLHREALSALVGRRAATYLASELRGQLLEREVDLVVEDRMARGRARKVIHVRPRRYLGERLADIGPVEVPGGPPIRLEIYLVGENAESVAADPIAVYAGGTLAAEIRPAAGRGAERRGDRRAGSGHDRGR